VARPALIKTTVPAVDDQGCEYRIPITEAICLAVEDGCTVEHAAGAVGVSKTAVFNWLARGQEWADVSRRPTYASGKKKGQPKPLPATERPYVEFLARYARAKDGATVWHLRNVARHAQNDWRASAWWLERRHPERYGNRVQIDTDPGERIPEPVDRGTTDEVHDAFVAAHVPEGAIDELLPALHDDANEEAPTDE
jgi:hypothetical protein